MFIVPKALEQICLKLVLKEEELSKKYKTAKWKKNLNKVKLNHI